MLAVFFRYAAYLMAGVFLAAIAVNILGFEQAIILAQIGIAGAVAIPMLGIVLTLVILFKNGETKFALIAIILLLFISVTAIWRLLV